MNMRRNWHCTCIFTYATIYWSKAHARLYYKAYNSVPNWHCTRMQALASPPFQNSYESNETSPLANYKWTTSTTNTWPKDHLTLHKVYRLNLGGKNRVTICYISPCTSFSSSSSAISRFFGCSNGRLFLWIVKVEFKIWLLKIVSFLVFHNVQRTPA